MEYDPLTALFRRAAASARDGDHLPDDLDLASRWADGLLSESEADDVYAHVAGCPRCRAWMRLQQAEGRVQLRETTFVELSPVRRRRSRLSYVVAALASAGLAAALWLTLLPTRPTESPLAQVRAAAAAEDWNETWRRLAQLNRDDLTASESVERDKLREEAVYRLAASDLRAGRFDSVKAWDAEAASGRIANLVVQADVKATAEVTLTRGSSLLDYFVDLDGRPLRQKGAVFLPASYRRQLEALSVKHPETAVLHANQGNFWLSQDKYEPAAAEYAEAVRCDPKLVIAHLGLGLAKFQRKEPEAALISFMEARRLDPSSIPAAVNTAIALTALKRTGEAADAWRIVLKLPIDDVLRQSVTAFLAR